MKKEDVRISHILVFGLVAAITSAITWSSFNGIYTFWHELGHAVIGGYREGFTVDWSNGHGYVGTYRDGALVSAAGTFMPPIFAILILWLAPWWLRGYSVSLLAGAYSVLASRNLTDFNCPGAYEVAAVLTVLASIGYLVMLALMIAGKAPKLRIPKITGFSIDQKNNRLVIHKTTK